MNFRLLGLLAMASPLFGAYQYYFSDTFSSINSGAWTQNGSLSAGGGLSSGSAGSLISTVAAPGPAGYYEVKMTLGVQNSGATYVAYLQASPDALLTANTATGTFYAVQATPQNGLCTLSIMQSLSGSIFYMTSRTMAGCANGAVIRVVALPASAMYVYLNNVEVLSTYAPNIGSGQPGVGVINAAGGSGIARVDLGPLDTTPPNAVPASGIAAMPFVNRVELQWQGASDSPGGTGVYQYYVSRDGTYLGGSQQTTFTDESVAPGSSYVYTLSSMDFHRNNGPSTSFTVHTPPAGSVDPRQVGARPNGTYWGGAGERIDMRSGNVNFTLPLLKAMGRGGWGVNFNLTYNSQNWTQDTAGNSWNLGRDVGYGYGWRLLAGSLTPYWVNYFTLGHYIYIDASGAEYRLDQNNGGVWSSKESLYVWYDSNAGRLYFRDGSFWTMGCTSGGTEQDAGSMYPTAMEDSNGNVVNLTYNTGGELSWPNSSARIAQIADVRFNPTYRFTYNGDAVPHLTGILDQGGGGAGSYSLQIAGLPSLNSPFNGASFGSSSLLQSVTQTNTNMRTSFAYDSGGAVS